MEIFMSWTFFEIMEQLKGFEIEILAEILIFLYWRSRAWVMIIHCIPTSLDKAIDPLKLFKLSSNPHILL